MQKMQRMAKIKLLDEKGYVYSIDVSEEDATKANNGNEYILIIIIIL